MVYYMCVHRNMNLLLEHSKETVDNTKEWDKDGYMRRWADTGGPIWAEEQDIEVYGKRQDADRYSSLDYKNNRTRRTTFL